MEVLLIKILAVVLSVTLQRSCHADDSGDSRHRRHVHIHPHTHLPTNELIQARGYPAEVHHVVTEDGYILGVHRIPYSPRRSHHKQDQWYPAQQEFSSQNAVKRSLDLQLRNDSSSHHHSSSSFIINREQKVVFIQHCVLCSSADFVMNDPDQALAFLLSDEGYDVWLGNGRGNIYSRRHVTLSPKHPQFWDFSWDKMSRYDLPAMLGYVRKTTGVNKLSYVGHSMGTSVFFAMMSMHPHINSWINVMAAMAPVAYMHNKHAPLRIVAPIIFGMDRSLTESGRLEFLTPTEGTSSLFSGACSPKSILRFICNFLVDFVGGPSSTNVDQNYLPVIMAHTPAGSSFHVLTHFMQIVNDKRFQAFDYGPSRNYKEYGSLKPPPFQLSAVTVPVGAFWSDADWVADKRDVQHTLRDLPNVVLNHRVQHKHFNHLDFLWAESAGYLVYRHVISLLNHYN